MVAGVWAGVVVDSAVGGLAMSVTFRCKCGRWLRTTSDPVIRCPNCLRTVTRPLWLWWVFGSMAGVLAVVAVVASVWPRSPVAVDHVETPIPSTTTVGTPPPTQQRTPPPTPKPISPLTQRPTEPAPPQAKPVAPVPELPRVGKLVVEPAGKYKEGDTFAQTVTVVRSSACGTLGVVVTQAAEYTLDSKLEVTKVNADGSIVVTQTVQSGKLLDATADMKEPLADALKKAVGAKFELAIAPNGKVTSLKGLDDPVRVKLTRDVELITLRAWSVLDADGWKELAGLTFFQPDKPGTGVKFARDFSHDWGPLGSWLGRTDYTTAAKPEKDGRHKIDYSHAISHRPATNGRGELLLTIRASAFPSVTACGTIRYDTATNRVTAAEELFHVRGEVRVRLTGTDNAVEVEERQKFRLTAAEVKPRELVGQPGRK
jgi:hypothetical protein